MGEQPIFTTKAHVFQIDPNTKKKWLPASSQAINVSYYHDGNRNSYRIISVEGSKAVINSTISHNMTFTKTSQKFGQWSDTKANTVYGLGFASEAELTKFVEKFKEVKELMRKEAQKSPTPHTTNGSDEVQQEYDNSNNHSPLQVALVNSVQNDSRPQSPGMQEKRLSPVPTSIPSSNLTEAQLKYENDRLKIALAQSSANAKNWEVELQTLRNNNARLMTALQESTANVEEWKKQLAAYKEESARMKKKVLDMEQSSGDDEHVQMLQAKVNTSVQQQQQLQQEILCKDQEILQLKQKYEDLLPFESLSQRLQEKLKIMESSNAVLTSQVQQQETELEQVKSKQQAEKSHMLILHQQLHAKLQELTQLQAQISTSLNT